MGTVAYAATKSAIKVGMRMDVWDLIWNSGVIVKFVLLLLLTFSVLSWAIIFAKNAQVTRVSLANSRFLDIFWKATSLDSIFNDIQKFKGSSCASVFKAGYTELQRIAEAKNRNKAGDDGVTLTGIDNISRALRKASDNEIASLEGRTSFLATVGSTSPFIGLFGTVWGIMTAFQNIGNTGAASLAVVAPGISEALITTAVGLAAAIPAVMGYNYFVGKFRKQDLELSNFNSDFLNIVKRNFFKD
jgi:biopolymer transport protein TolQ